MAKKNKEQLRNNENNGTSGSLKPNEVIEKQYQVKLEVAWTSPIHVIQMSRAHCHGARFVVRYCCCYRRRCSNCFDIVATAVEKALLSLSVITINILRFIFLFLFSFSEKVFVSFCQVAILLSSSSRWIYLYSFVQTNTSIIRALFIAWAFSIIHKINAVCWLREYILFVLSASEDRPSFFYLGSPEKVNTRQYN